MTRDEILSVANERLNLVNDRCQAEVREIERQRIVALSTIAGVTPLLHEHDSACQRADADRARARAAADALVASANQKGSDSRYAATGKAIADAEAAKAKAEREREDKYERAEEEYEDAVGAAGNLPGSPAVREKARQDARAKRDLAIRTANREYARLVEAADRQYADDLAAAAAEEVDIVQAALRQSTADKAAAEAAYRAAIHAADDAQHEALLRTPPAGAVQEAFDARRTQTERESEDQKAAIFAWMKEELGKLGPGSRA